MVDIELTVHLPVISNRWSQYLTDAYVADPNGILIVPLPNRLSNSLLESYKIV